MNDFRLHRRSVAQKLSDGLVLLSGGVETPRNHDVNFVFHQKSNFLYLTGVAEPGCFVLLDPKRNREILLIPKVDSHFKVWIGTVPTPREARTQYQFQQAAYVEELPRLLARAKRGYKKCYADPDSLKKFSKELQSLKNFPSDLEEAFEEARACKTPGEIERIRKANEISGEGHLAVMAAARPGMREFELQAEFEFRCMRQGLRHQGYPPIVATGVNGAILHYHRNDAVLKKGDLLLIDAGAECGGYSADITRTFPVGGKFSRRQRDVYSIVLEAQRQCIARATAGTVTGELHVHSARILTEGLLSLGLLRGSVDGLLESGAFRLFYPHGLSHMLGLDVHDCLGGKMRQLPNPGKIPVRFNARLEPGFVVTMEPGIYFNPALINDKALRKKFRGQIDFSKAEDFLDFGGIRIEDDVAIQPSGPPINLTSVPKEIDEIEAACGR